LLLVLLVQQHQNHPLRGLVGWEDILHLIVLDPKVVVEEKDILAPPVQHINLTVVQVVVVHILLRFNLVV
tara:strand:- start:466 stop:675 length:210 start_codon:yes stop_codon:yes gene_type:complete